MDGVLISSDFMLYQRGNREGGLINLPATPVVLRGACNIGIAQCQEPPSENSAKLKDHVTCPFTLRVWEGHGKWAEITSTEQPARKELRP